MHLQDTELLRHQAYVDGEWVDADSGACDQIIDPATGSALVSVPHMGRDETVRAIVAAEKALPSWRSLTVKERAVILQRWRELVLQHRNDLATIMTLEQGKPLDEAKAEVVHAAAYIEWFAEEGKRVYGETIPSPSSERRLMVIKQAMGVVGAITPWNFPCSVVTRKVAPALAAGCTVVLKPAPQTPLTALALAELAARAGMPTGVFNVVTGDAEAIGRALTDHPSVAKLSFTGSTQTGKQLLRQCADSVKKVAMELGGHAPYIVFDDADIDAAVQGAIASKYRCSGQTCVCANRIYVQRAIYPVFVERFAKATRALTLGNGFNANSDLGPLIDQKAVNKVERHVENAVKQGAQLLCGGERSSIGKNFYLPTILSDVTHDMLITQEETFGPVAAVIPFDTEDEVVQYANATRYGLAAYFFTSDISRLFRLPERLEYGMVGVNTGSMSSEMAPFGGVKESGIGREGSHHGIDEFLDLKYVCVGGLS